MLKFFANESDQAGLRAAPEMEHRHLAVVESGLSVARLHGQTQRTAAGADDGRHGESIGSGPQNTPPTGMIAMLGIENPGDL
ncbi:MAG: hypothetical protein P8J37_03695 [Fuerstiella sp.]|nr:hypothetical protein [Fuerstiella sp.]